MMPKRKRLPVDPEVAAVLERAREQTASRDPEEERRPGIRGSVRKATPEEGGTPDPEES